MTCRRVAVVPASLLAGMLLGWSPLAGAANGQPVLLQIRPRIGDTLSVRMDQQVEMNGVPAGCVSGAGLPRNNTSQRPQPRLCSDVTRHMTTRMEVFSRAIVRRSGNDATMLLAVTDSIRTSASSVAGTSPTPIRASAPPSTIEFRVASDGAAEVTDASASDELRAIFGQMPAMLSKKAVSVGEKWTREMRIPLAAEPGGNTLVRATFQLDSLGQNGDLAYISMRGKLSHDHKDGSESEVAGTLAGAMQLDRRLAWITETRARIDLRSTVRPATGPSMMVTTRITQYLKASRVR